ncbi:unnamed protein product [Mytilus coruscus]|uniref:B box-type domain-containing protein n=1 Tax=Mytilus coruscus TaxID=42192 RepID=A0A6J8EQU9_MYTCO|nr:unnamed protein product [Mytilus coruscus]
MTIWKVKMMIESLYTFGPKRAKDTGIWTGANSPTHDENFVFAVDNGAFSLTNLPFGERDSISNNDCVEIELGNSDVWNLDDDECNDEYRFIYEFPRLLIEQDVEGSEKNQITTFLTVQSCDNLLPGYILYVERMSTNQKACNICDYQYITKPATDCCSECEQAFCSECKVFHGFSRLSQNHATIPISDYLSLEASFATTTIICTEHDEIFQMICQTHDKLLCLNCIDKHNDCKNIVPMNEVTKNVKTSTNFQETRQGLTYGNESITKIQDELKLNLKTINDDEKKIVVEIDTMRKKIDDYLDKLEHDLRKNLSEEATKSRNSIEVMLYKLADRKSEITKTLHQMKELEEFASDFQTYLSLRQISSIVDSVESFLQSLVHDGKIEIDTLSLSFSKKINKLCEIQQFGSVQVQKKACHMPLIRQKEKQAQLVGLRRIGIQKIRLDDYKVSTIVYDDSSTLRYVAIHNNKLYYTDRLKNVVTCCDMDGQVFWTFRDETVLKGPRGLSIDNQGFIYVASHEIDSVVTVVLSPDGKDKIVLLSNSDGLVSPRALHYTKLRNQVLVTNENDKAFLFDVTAKL